MLANFETPQQMSHSHRSVSKRRINRWVVTGAGIALSWIAGLVQAATHTVTSNADSAPGSLRAQIAAAAPGDTIVFNVAGTITLTTGELYLDKNLIIQGPGATHLTISGNNASRVFNIEIGTTIAIDGLTISGGSATSSGGGIGSSGTLTLSNSAITGNAAENGGGLSNFGTAALINCTVSGNVSNDNGGGIYNSDGTLAVTNSTVSANMGPSGGGGGIYSYQGSVTLTNSTITGNVGGQGGGIYDYSGVLILNNSILAGNIDNNERPDASVPVAPGITSNGHNFIGDTVGISNAASLSDKTFANTGTALSELLVVDGEGLPVLGYNGGSTLTIALATGSQAIDAGANADALGSNDQRGTGFLRVVNSTVDIGSFEAQVLPADLISDLKDYINAQANIKKAIKNSLTAKLNVALAALVVPDVPLACQSMQDFLNLVQAQRGKKQITVAQADYMIAQASDIRLLIGCS